MVKVFISYCHKNSKLIEPFLDYIHPLWFGDKPAFKIWIDDNNIKVGENLSNEIEKGILEADIAILCLTRKYLRSNSCIEEKNKFLELRKLSDHKELSVLPLIFEDCAWTAESVGLKDIKALNYDGRPFHNFRDKDFWLKDTVSRLELYVSALSQESLRYRDANNHNIGLIGGVDESKADFIESTKGCEILLKIPSENLKNIIVDFLKRFFPNISIVKSGNYTGDKELSRKFQIRGTGAYMYNILCIMSWMSEDNIISGLEYENLSNGDIRHDKSISEVLEILKEDYGRNGNNI